jgi:hypothetical protein
MPIGWKKSSSIVGLVQKTIYIWQNYILVDKPEKKAISNYCSFRYSPNEFDLSIL